MRGFLVLVVGLLTPSAFADELDDAHRRLLERRDLQFTFTGPEPETRTQSVGWLADLFRALSPVFTVIFWVALAAIVLAIVLFIGRETWTARYGRDKQRETAPPVQTTEYRPAPERARALLQDADRLAEQGLYEEAVRTLLHRSIDDIEGRSPRAIRTAQTSREIASLPILTGKARDAFAPLVRAVERSWFGGMPLGRDDYNACRESYARFALPEAWT